MGAFSWGLYTLKKWQDKVSWGWSVIRLKRLLGLGKVKSPTGEVSGSNGLVEDHGEKIMFTKPVNCKFGLIVTVMAITAANVLAVPLDDDLLQKIVSKYSYQRIVCLDVGEQYTFVLKNGTKKNIKLLSVSEYRDSVLKKPRWANVDIEIDGKVIRLKSAPYVMPTEIEGLRIQADTTSTWLKMPKRVQFSVWDATDPIVKTDQLAFPVRNYLLFSHGIQNYNEVVHLGRRDGNPNGPNFYHNYGVDFAGYEAAEVVLSPVEGKAVTLWPDKDDYAGVIVEDENGLIWAMCHLDSRMPSIVYGRQVKKGQPVGILGMQVSSGRFSHLHVGTYTRSADGEVRREDRNLRLNLYPWFVAAYKELPNRQRLFAVARPHHSVTIGDKVVFDGSNSLAFESKIAAYRWQFHDGQTIDNKIAEKTFDKPGTFIATLYVKDDKGTEDIDFCKVKVYPSGGQLGGIPTIFMTYTPTMDIMPDQAVQFRMWIQGASRQTPIEVDFGDGTVISDYKSFSSIQHRFKTPGIHIITAEAMVGDLPITQKQKLLVRDK